MTDTASLAKAYNELGDIDGMDVSIDSLLAEAAAEDNAASRIQAGFRGMASRSNTRKEKGEQTAAALKIQQQYRRHSLSKKTEETLDQEKVAIQAQAPSLEHEVQQSQLHVDLGSDNRSDSDEGEVEDDEIEANNDAGQGATSASLKEGAKTLVHGDKCEDD